MTRASLTILLLILTRAVQAQELAVANLKMNIFYKGVENPISFAVDGVSKKSLIVKAKNGTIRKQNGHYTFHSDSIGKAQIIVYKIVQGRTKEIGRSVFRVKAIPNPIPKVGQSAGGQILTAVLKAQEYLRAEIEEFDIDVKISIDSFTLCITREDPCFHKELHNVGNKFSQEVLDALKEIQKGDTVTFKNIFAKNMYGEPKELHTIVFVCL